jgi:WXG100 family type VII secretion target
MNADIIQADYEALETIANRFQQGGEHISQMQQSLLRAVDQLRDGGWIGEGADSFFTEMDDAVVPAVQRLIQALEQAGQTTQQICQQMENAEDEASASFKNETESQAQTSGGGSGGGSSGSGSGGGGDPSQAGQQSGATQAQAADDSRQHASFRHQGARESGDQAATQSSGAATGSAATTAPAEADADPGGGGIPVGLAGASPFIAMAAKAAKDKADKSQKE